ncbi:unnamed protein product, partial [Durusdinium trenchii]
ERRAEKWTPRHGESTRTGRLRCFFAGQVDESEIWSTFVYRGAWKWEYEHALHLYNKELPVVLLLDSVGYIRWHAVGLPTEEATETFQTLARRLAHEKRNFT